MTESELRSWAETFFPVAQAELERTGTIAPRFLLHYPSGRINMLEMPPGTEHLMNDGPAKAVLFQFLRQAVQETGADAFITVQDMWHGKYTPEGMEHYEEAQKIHFQGMQELIAKGWVVRTEIVNVVAQSAEVALMVTRPYERVGQRIRWLGDPEAEVVPQERFEGRLKMFGEDLRPEKLG